MLLLFLVDSNIPLILCGIILGKKWFINSTMKITHKNTGNTHGNTVVRLRKLSLLFLVVTLTCSISFPAITQAVNMSSPVDRSRVYSTYHFLVGCLNLSGSRIKMDSTLDHTKLSNGNVFYRDNMSGAGPGVNTNIRTGWLIEDTDAGMPSGDGWSECGNNDPGRFLAAIDINPLSFFTSGTGLYESGSSNYTLKTDSRSEQITLIREEFERRFPTVNFNGDMTPEMYYWPLLKTAQKKCGLTDDNVVPDSTRQIGLVDITSGDIVVKGYHLSLNGNEHSVGWGIPGSTSESSNRGHKMNCSRIINLLESAGNQASSAMKSYYSTGGATPEEPASDGTSGPDRDSCESNGGPFGWILCWVVDSLILNSLDFFADQIQQRLDVAAPQKGPMYDAWSNIRTVANIVFVLVFLAIIISQTIVGRF